MISHWKHFLRSGLKSSSNNSDAMEFRRVCGYCIYWSLVWKLLSLCLWRMFNTNLQSMRQIGEELLYVLKAFYKQVVAESIDPFGLSCITGKNCTNFLWNVFVTYLMCAITKINKSQKISTCYVKYVLLILEKKQKRKGLIDLFGPSRVKMITNQRLS